MSGKVISLKGDPIYAGEADPAVVALLEKILEEARSGEVVAIAIVKIYRDGGSGDHFRGTCNPRLMAGCLAEITHDIFVAEDAK
jgi:hypothetical protein